MTAEISVEIDFSDVQRYLDEGREAIARAIDAAAEDLAAVVGEEAESSSHRLGEPWPIEQVGEDRRVYAPEFFAHFLARGTRDHGPRSGEFLVFEQDGQMVFARRVRGIPANPFGERAVERTEERLDAIITETFEEIR